MTDFSAGNNRARPSHGFFATDCLPGGGKSAPPKGRKKLSLCLRVANLTRAGNLCHLARFCGFDAPRRLSLSLGPARSTSSSFNTPYLSEWEHRWYEITRRS
jgi:hypothetical protein